MKTIAFQGELGAFSELAALKFFDGQVSPVACPKFDDVFQNVLKGRVNYGIAPIENSLSGSIHQNYDLLLKVNLHIVGEIKLRISHCLIANPGVSISAIKKVYSHPVALAQCQKLLRSLKGVEAISHYDTAGAVKFIQEHGIRDAAAIASRQAASSYGMKILKAAIEDNDKNFTRFFILARKPVPAKGRCKTSIVFSLKNLPGALYKSLSVFAIQDIDLHKIESRPIPGSPWQYIFYLDLEGNIADKGTKRAIEHLREITTFLKVLGSYPIGKEVHP